MNVLVSIHHGPTADSFTADLEKLLSDDHGLQEVEDDLRATLARGEAYRGGGGAAPAFTIQPRGDARVTKISNDDRRDLRIGARLQYDASYRITAEGEVHFHGKMPNSNEEGWWLFAQSVEEALDRLRNRRG